MAPTWVEVTDPRQPLFSRRLQLIADGPNRVILLDAHGVTVQVPRRSTSLSLFVDDAPRVKLSRPVAEELLSLVKEYEVWTRHKSFGNRSPLPNSKK